MTLTVTQNISKFNLTVTQTNNVVELQPIINTSDSSTFVETDPIFLASEAALFQSGDKANLDNQSGVNTGDETTNSIQTKRPLKTINNESLEGTGNIEITGVDVHNELTGRSEADCHPISAITGLQAILDEILYVAPVISNFTASPNDVEIGTTITSITLNWNLNKTFTSLSINQGIGAITPSLTNFTHTPISLTSNTTYTITGGDGTNTTTANRSISFRARRWWGTSPLDTFNSSDILTLQNSELASNRQQTRTINGGGNYIWFAFPTSFGTPNFVVNGLPNTAFTTTTISHTNALGHTQNYFVIRTNTVQFGTLTIQLL